MKHEPGPFRAYLLYLYNAGRISGRQMLRIYYQYRQ